jgi:hypothetical protein
MYLKKICLIWKLFKNKFQLENKKENNLSRIKKQLIIKKIKLAKMKEAHVFLLEI